MPSLSQQIYMMVSSVVGLVIFRDVKCETFIARVLVEIVKAPIFAKF